MAEDRSRLVTEVIANNYGFEATAQKMSALEKRVQTSILNSKLSTQSTAEQAAVIGKSSKTISQASQVYDLANIKTSQFNKAIGESLVYEKDLAAKIETSNQKIIQAARATGMRYSPALQGLIENESKKIKTNTEALEDQTKRRMKDESVVGRMAQGQKEANDAIAEEYENIKKARGMMSGQILTQETYNRKKAELNAMEQAFGPQKKYTTQLMQLEERRFRDITGAQKDASVQMAQYREQLDGMNKGHGRSYLGMLKWAAGWMLAYGVLRSVVNAIGGAWQTTIDYNKAIMEMAAVMGGTKQEAEALGDAAISMGKKFGIGALEVLQGFQTWLRQGKTAKETTEAMNATLLLSNVAMMTTAESASALTAVLQEYNLTTDQLVSISDKWIALDMEFATTAADIAAGFKIAGSTAKELGMDIDTLNSLIAVVASTTQRSGNQVATALRTMFTRTYRADTTKDLAEQARIATSTTAGLKPLAQIYDELAVKWHTLTKAQKEQISETISGVRQNNMFFAMMSNWNRVLHGHWVSVNAAGDAFSRNEKIMAEYQKQLASMGPTWTDFKKSLGEIFAPNVVIGLQNLTNAMEGILNTRKFNMAATDLEKFIASENTLVASELKSGKTLRESLTAWAGYSSMQGDIINKSFKYLLQKKLITEEEIRAAGTLKQQIELIDKYNVVVDTSGKILESTKDKMLAFARAHGIDYDAINNLMMVLKQTVPLMEQLKYITESEISVIDLNVVSRNRSIAAFAANRREILRATSDLKTLKEKQDIYTKAIEESADAYAKGLGGIPRAIDLFVMSLTEAKMGDAALVEQYGKHRDILDPLIENIRKANGEYQKSIEFERLLAVVDSIMAKNTSSQLEDAQKSVKTVMEQRKQNIEYTKALIDNAAEIDKNRLAIVKLADTIESSLINAIADVMEDFSKANETMNDFVNGLAKIANQSIAGGFYNMLGLNKFSRLAATGSVALNNPEDYRNFMETAGMNVGKTWRNEFVTGGDYIRQSIENGSKRGAEKYAGAGIASVTANNDVAMAAVGMAAIRLTAGVGGRERAGQNPYYTEDRSLMERYQDVMYSDASWYQKGMAYTGETIIEGAQEVGQAIGWGAKQVKKGFNWYSEQMSTATGRIIEQLGVMYLITRGNIDDFKNTKAGEFASIGSMLGALLGPGGSLIGALLGQQLGRYVKDPIAEQTETESQKLENINDTLKVSLAELEYVNRNLYAMRQTNDPYPVRDAWYFRPYTFGDGGFSKSGGMSWGKPNQYSNSGSGQSVTVGSINISIPSGDPQAIVNALSEAFSLQNIRVYQGA